MISPCILVIKKNERKIAGKCFPVLLSWYSCEFKQRDHRPYKINMFKARYRIPWTSERDIWYELHWNTYNPYQNTALHDMTNWLSFHFIKLWNWKVIYCIATFDTILFYNVGIMFSRDAADTAHHIVILEKIPNRFRTKIKLCLRVISDGSVEFSSCGVPLTYGIHRVSR